MKYTKSFKRTIEFLWRNRSKLRKDHPLAIWDMALPEGKLPKELKGVKLHSLDTDAIMDQWAGLFICKSLGEYKRLFAIVYDVKVS